MTDQYPTPGSPSEPPPSYGTPPPVPPPPPMYNTPYPPAPAVGYAPVAMPASGPAGQVRGTGFAIFIFIITAGIYGWYWYYKVHQEMKNHSGQGLGGGVALLLAIFVGIAMPYVTSSEVGNLYKRRGQEAPVSAATGLWSFPGALILVGPIVWFVKTNAALNDYWVSVGAPRP